MSPQQARLPGLPGNPHSAQAQHDRALAGGAAEAFVDQLHQACALARVAWVQRVSSHIKITRDLGRGRVEGRLTGKSVVDAVGVLSNGRGVAIEIKHVAVERLKSGGEAAWRLPLARLEEHQASMLATFDQAGGLALVLVIHAGQAFAVPWPVVATALTAGAASLSAEQLAPHRCPPGRPYLARFLSKGSP